MIENYKISNEEFKNKFSDWLFEQSLSNFTDLNGFEIVRTFVKFYFGKDLLVDKYDYQLFISEKRFLIKVIEIWISTFNLSFDDYKIFFENYCNGLLEEDNISKLSFTDTCKNFQNEVIKPNFLVDRGAIIRNELRLIFLNAIKKSKEELKSEKIAADRKLKKELKTEKIAADKKLKDELKTEKIAADKASKEELKALYEVIKQEIEGKIKICKKCGVVLSETNPSQLKKYGKICDKCLKEQISEYRKEYKKKFPNIIKVQKKRYKNRRMSRDDSFKILNRIRNRMLLVLEGKRKLQSSLNLLGCSPDFLKNYLESKFTGGMTWDNYGVKGWHIDHIMPCSSFDFTLLEDQKKCFHYSNLQPLWWQDNLMKSDKMP